jgi:hypothetical protein
MGVRGAYRDLHLSGALGEMHVDALRAGSRELQFDIASRSGRLRRGGGVGRRRYGRMRLLGRFGSGRRFGAFRRRGAFDVELGRETGCRGRGTGVGTVGLGFLFGSRAI